MFFSEDDHAKDSDEDDVEVLYFGNTSFDDNTGNIKEEPSRENPGLPGIEEVSSQNKSIIPVDLKAHYSPLVILDEPESNDEFILS